MRRVYLDHNATTPVRPAVIERMGQVLREEFGNPRSITSYGRAARQVVDRARGSVASAMGASPGEIVLCSGGTEAANHALFGVTRNGPPGRDRDKVVTSAAEHQAVLEPCAELRRRGWRIISLPVDAGGLVDLAEAERVIDRRTALVSVMMANNVVGTLQPVQEIAVIGRAHGALIHTDAVQALGKIPIDVKRLGVDLLSVSSHKIGGPKGVGALFIRDGLRLTPLIRGGSHERSRRAGTENVPGIAGFGEACEEAIGSLSTEPARLRELRDRLEREVNDRIAGCRVNGRGAPRIPNTTNLAFEGIDAEILVMGLDQVGIVASAGAACSSEKPGPPQVLRAMGLDDASAASSIRVSLGWSTTPEDVDLAVERLVDVVARLRAAGEVVP